MLSLSESDYEQLAEYRSNGLEVRTVHGFTAAGFKPYKNADGGPNHSRGNREGAYYHGGEFGPRKNSRPLTPEESLCESVGTCWEVYQRERKGPCWRLIPIAPNLPTHNPRYNIPLWGLASAVHSTEEYYRFFKVCGVCRKLLSKADLAVLNEYIGFDSNGKTVLEDNEFWEYLNGLTGETE